MPAHAGVELDQALDLLKRGQFSEAVVAAQKAVAAEPGSTQARLTLAQAAEATGDIRLAGLTYAKAVELEPSNAEISLAAGDFLVRQGELAMADQFYILAFEAASDKLVPLRRKAAALSAQAAMGRKEVAVELPIAAWEAVLKDPQCGPEDFYGLADCCLLPPYDTARLDKCQQSIEQGRARWPDSGLLMYALARLDVRRFKSDQALAHYKRAVQLGLPALENRLALEQIKLLEAAR